MKEEEEEEEGRKESLKANTREERKWERQQTRERSSSAEYKEQTVEEGKRWKANREWLSSTERNLLKI